MIEQSIQLQLDGVKWRDTGALAALEKRDLAPLAIAQMVGDQPPLLGSDQPVMGHAMPFQQQRQRQGVFSLMSR